MIRVCARCGTPVSYATVSAGYACVCPAHDEDLELYETELRKI